MGAIGHVFGESELFGRLDFWTLVEVLIMVSIPGDRG
jgi:hypothetical protein